MKNAQHLGIWLEASGEGAALGSLESIQKSLQRMQALGISDVFVQVYREGKAWYPSSIADPAPYEVARTQGFEPLPLILSWAKEHSIRVHAWINVFNLGANSEARILTKLGKSVLQQDNAGKSVESYSCDSSETFLLDAPRYWLDPAQPAVREYVGSIVKELMQMYPSLSGLHLDYVRYPYILPLKPSSRISVGFDFGYQPVTIEKFAALISDALPFITTNGKLTPKNDEIALEWDRFRRQSVTQYLSDFRGLLTSSQVLSVAAMPWPERAFYTAFQNWRAWLTEDLVDFVCLMSYTADDEHFKYLNQQAKAFQGKRSKVWTGVGSYLLEGKTHLQRQIFIAREMGLAPIIFSYRNLPD